MKRWISGINLHTFFQLSEPQIRKLRGIGRIKENKVWIYQKITNKLKGSWILYSLRTGLKKIGGTTEGLMLFTNLKNSYIFMKPEQKLVFESLFTSISICSENSEYILALQAATKQLEDLESFKEEQKEEESNAKV